MKLAVQAAKRTADRRWGERLGDDFEGNKMIFWQEVKRVRKGEQTREEMVKDVNGGTHPFFPHAQTISILSQYPMPLLSTTPLVQLHPLPCLNPHFSSPIAHSVRAVTLLISILPYNLPTTRNKLIPLWLLHSHLSPFPLFSGTIHAPRQSLGATPINKTSVQQFIQYNNNNIP